MDLSLREESAHLFLPVFGGAKTFIANSNCQGLKIDFLIS